MVKLIRTESGNYYIGEVLVTSENVVGLCHARELRIGMTMGGIGVGVTPINPFTIKDTEEIFIHEDVIIQEVDEDNIQTELLDRYKSEISGIQIAKNIPKDPTDIII